MPLLAAKAILLVLLCALGVRLAVASSAIRGLGVVVESDVEEVLFFRVANLCALTF
jgi:hypothetical protein